MLDPEERRRHLYIVGQTGTGKSTLLLNLIRQDLAAGEGSHLLDPHGDLAEAVLDHVPERAPTTSSTSTRPTSSGRSASIRCPACPHDLKPIVADGVVSAFRHVWPDSWGPRLDYILTNAVRALLDVPGATLLDAAPPAHRRAVPGAARRAPCRRSGGAVILAQRVCRLWRQLPHRSHLPRSRTRSARRSWSRGCATCWRSPRAPSRLRRLMDEGAIVICNLSKGALRREHRASSRRAPHHRHRPGRAVPRRHPRSRTPDVSISMPTSSNRSPPRALPSFSPRRASTPSRSRSGTSTSTSSPMSCAPPCSATSARSSPAAPAPPMLRSSPSRSASADPDALLDLPNFTAWARLLRGGSPTLSDPARPLRRVPARAGGTPTG